MLPLNLLWWYLGAAAALYVIGLYALVSTRNMIKTVIAIEILIDGAHLNFVAFAATPIGGVDPIAHSIVVTSIIIGGCIAAIALSLAINAYKHYGTIDIKKLRRLRE
ncbi:MAG: NADH-quinone oxidoreductase subunit K [Candidatus Odinarchaeum yellowstonii]|uniref:NADH-quinone oxidoreductase subunit K n=1 Tax=Odinarchaeota yellowstonii (strain LCB_4) TaxID=1841599 RepID=A0AAF0D1R2_ODILC|nr:MAG: NADH-quinone oxidoreductase subunit K [Candidatus Odinarchaeum yellowstonii]